MSFKQNKQTKTDNIKALSNSFRYDTAINKINHLEPTTCHNIKFSLITPNLIYVVICNGC